MRKYYLSLLLCLLASMFVSAQDGIALGYCGGEIRTPGILKVPDAAIVSGAIYLTPDQLAAYAGNEISQVNAGLATKLNISELTVWVREALDGENLASATLTKTSSPALAKGWNKVKLTSPVAISGNQGLYVGFSFKQSKQTLGLSTVGTYRENGLFLQQKQGGEWTSPTTYGVLSCEAIVTGDNLPMNHVAILDASGDKILGRNGTLSINARVRNTGGNGVTSLELKGQIDGEGQIHSATANLSLPVSEIGNVTLEIPMADYEAGRHKAHLWIASVNGVDCANPDVTMLDFSLLEQAYRRVVLVEEFTTESCGFCPGAATALHTALDNLGDRADDVVVSCHHSGYYTDWLTQPCDNDLVWLYGTSGTYAPAFMINRVKDSSDGVPVFGNPGAAALQSRISDALDEVAMVGLKVTGTIDADAHTITVHVTGERGADLCAEPRITVYAVEDGVAAHNQASGGSNYIHNHVLRAYNSTWGDVIDWNGDTFTYDCTLEFVPTCVTENMQVFAFINGYNSADRNDCNVYNAAVMTDPETGVEQLTAGAGSQAAPVYYELSGRRVAQPQGGIFIRVQDGKATKVLK